MRIIFLNIFLLLSLNNNHVFVLILSSILHVEMFLKVTNANTMILYYMFTMMYGEILKRGE